MSFLLKDDLKASILIDELDQIVRQDDTIIQQALDQAESELRGYLFDSYDVDSIFAQTETDRHQLLVRYGADIAVYYLVATVQAGQDVEDRKSRYDRACKWLKMVQSSKLYSDLPRREETVQNHIVTGSNDKRKNYF